MQKHFDKAQCRQKGVSTLIGIIIIIAVAVVAGGGVFAYQYFATKTQPVVQTQQNQNQNNQTAQPSITVTSPNGGEVWKIGETHNITWTTDIPYEAGCHSSLSLQDSNGNTVGFLTSSMAKGQTSFSWDTTKQLFSGTCMTGATSFNLSPGTYRIKLLSESGDVPGQPDITAYSNYFSIVAPTSQTAGWKTYTNTQYGFEFQYPTKFDTDYAGFNNAPVAVVTSQGNANIDNKGCLASQGIAPKDSIVTINGSIFCLSTSGEAAMGSVYYSYYYTTLKNGNYYTLEYTVKTPNCGVYMNDPDINSPTNLKYRACIDSGKNYDNIVLKPIQDSVATFKFTK